MKLNPYLTKAKPTCKDCFKKAMAQLDAGNIPYERNDAKNSVLFRFPTASSISAMTGLWGVGINIGVDNSLSWRVTGVFLEETVNGFTPWEFPKNFDKTKLKLFLYELSKWLFYGHFQWTGKNLGFYDNIPVNDMLCDYVLQLVMDLSVAYVLLKKWDTIPCAEIEQNWVETKVQLIRDLLKD